MTESEWLNLLTPANVVTFNIIIIVISIWSLVWKGFALWKAAKNDDKVWYVVLLILNTIGILEILYIYVFSKRKPS